MKIFKHAGVAVLSLATALAWAGGHESTEATADAEKPYIFASQSMQITAEVVAINHDTREVTLRGPQGNEVTLIVSEEARNLGQVEAGDLLNAEYVQSVSIEVMADPGLGAGTAELAAAGRSPEGAMPGMAVMDAQVITATVEEINLEANTFKLKGPEGNVREFTARNPENLKLAEVGDLVVITNTEALAISVEEAPSQ